MDYKVFQELACPGETCPYVSQFFSISILGSEMGQISPNYIVPDCTAGILIVEEGSLQRTDLKGNTQKLFGSYVFGQKTSTVRYSFEKSELIAFGLKLSPLALKVLFGKNPAVFTNHTLRLADKLPDFPITELRRASNLLDKSNLITSYLNGLIESQASSKLKLFHSILSFIHKSEIPLSVKVICQQFQLGYRSLERWFYEFVGIPPKMYLRLQRLNRLMAAHHSDCSSKLLHLALDQGYYDQMHLIREMKLFTAQTPSQYFSRPMENLEYEHRNFLSRHYASV